MGPKAKRVGAEGQGGKCSGRGETEGAAANYGGSEACRDGLDLNVKISIHFIGAPAAPDEADAVTVNAGAASQPGK